MAEGFLARYNEELAALRQRASRFAESFPKIAGRLRMTGEVVDDPHVERLIQSFAYSAARVRQKLDDEFPELTDSMLETLYPHYLAPLPSMSVVQFEPSKTLAGEQRIPRHTEILTEAIGGESCRFRTTQDVNIAPVELAEAKLMGQPIDAPASPFGGVTGCLRLSVRSLDPRRSLSSIGLSGLTFHITAPWQQAISIHELLCNHTVGIALARHSGDTAPLYLRPSQLRPLGFDASQSMLPYPAPSFEGYRLLTEFFALPQKYLFFQIDGLQNWREDVLEIFVYLEQANPKLERTVSKQDFALHATPVVNLFRRSCEPVAIDGARTEYRLVADARRQKTREIYGVERVVLTDARGQQETSRPFFGQSHRTEATTTFWQTYRRFEEEDGTSDTDIAFIDRHRRYASPVGTVASIEALCLNRELPEQLPFGGGHPHLQLASGHEAVGAAKALIPPTSSVRMNDQQGRSWRLISHLLLNHLSLTDGNGGALKDILSLYAFRDSPETRQFAEAIISVDAQPSLARMPQGSMVPGTDITITFDPNVIDDAAAYLFASVLDRFLGLYTSINSFTRLTARMRGKNEPIARWPARAAERPLL
ncbi:type VI secretion system baseplate subunit TssF [Rhizobium oryzicola]|uniref:Type VI secretion system baseplate subunit TssF n=1 Tax=Rhizobium oryzicola TaxID=1232668 RepID=A0ABT8SXE5_9HYPH|nr:type VI secretion system baseplate subunit TssF [Rhizobium oryzicola]MDO1583090.1 type VI secretion system baseplate subunit TssF [Rhizobium oryzicola]